MAGRLDPHALDRVAAGMRVAGVRQRLEILAAVAERGAMSPSEFALQSTANLREAAYHFRSLRDGQLVSLRNMTTSGGTVQHFYELTPLGQTLVDALPALAEVAPPKRPARPRA